MKSCSSNTAEIRRARPLLGTFVEITAPTGVAAGRAVDRAFAAIGRVQALMSAHDPGSDLARLARAPAGTVTVVHRWTWRVLQRAQALHRRTHGAFDPIAAARFGVTAGRLPAGAGGPGANAGWRDVKLLPGHRVRLLQAVRFDLGGIAKGFALDRAVAVLRAARLGFGLVNAGGDMRAFGSRAWPVFVRDPGAPGRLVQLGVLRDGAVATSGSYFSRATRGGVTTSALVDPRSRRSFVAATSATVFAPSGIVADALTKALLFGAAPGVLRVHRACGVVMKRHKGALRAA